MLSSTVSLSPHTDSPSRIPSFNLPIKSEIFFELFPFHIVFNRQMIVVSIGGGLSQAMKDVEGESIIDLFNLIRPLIGFSWDNVI